MSINLYQIGHPSIQSCIRLIFSSTFRDPFLGLTGTSLISMNLPIQVISSISGATFCNPCFDLARASLVFADLSGACSAFFGVPRSSHLLDSRDFSFDSFQPSPNLSQPTSILSDLVSLCSTFQFVHSPDLHELFGLFFQEVMTTNRKVVFDCLSQR
jgi:hypothetical protein